MKNPFHPASLAFLLVAITGPAHSAIVWDSGGDGVSVFAEANWTDNTGVNGTDPPADSVNPATGVLFDCIIDDNANAGGGGAGNHFDLGDGFSLTITDNAKWTSNVGGGYGIRGVAGGADEELIISTSNVVLTDFVRDLRVSLSGSAKLRLNSSGNPVENSTIDLASGFSGQVHFLSEAVANVQSEHLSKITVNGAPAIDSGVGQNVYLLSDGSTGSILALPADSDNDGIDDNLEDFLFGDLDQDETTDFDGDGLLDIDEINTHGTDPTRRDTDGDLLDDKDELTVHSTDPLNPDSDADGNPDGFEIAKGLDPTNDTSRLNQPNIIFILCDDLGYGDLGVLFQSGKSGKKHLTPNLDQLAAEGLVLNQHYCPAPVCAPSRGSLLQGVHQGHANVRDNQFDKAIEDNHTLGTTLQASGYSTAIIGKWGLQGGGGSPALWPAYPTKRGFDYFFGYVGHGDGHTHYPDHVTDSRGKKDLYDQNTMIRDDLDRCYTADLFTARAKKLIVDETAANPKRPFFLYLALDTPHAALQLPTVAYPAGSGTTGGLQWNGTPGSMINTATGTIDSYRHPDYTTAVGGAWTDVEERFATSVRRIDDCVGDLKQTLIDLGIDNNTLIVFSSDNGPHTEDYLTTAQTYDGSSYLPISFDSYGPFEGVKRDCWEGGIREPTIVWGPSIVGGATNNVNNPRTVNTPSQFHDWMPTFLDLTGWPAPSRTDGVSLLPTLSNTETQKDGTVYVEYDNSGSTPSYGDFPNHGGTTRSQSQVIRIKGSDGIWYKGIRTGIASHNDDFEIYNVDTDLKETTNLAGSSPFFDDLQVEMKNQVLRIRQPDTSAARPYDSEWVQPVTAVVQSGINWGAYEGLWPWMPEFRDLVPVSTGSDPHFNLGHLSKSEDAGLLFTGFIDIPTGGTWTFHATSDAGISLRIHESQVIDDDFAHDGSEASGTINLAPGLHPFRLYYRSGPDAPALNISWEGPGTAKTTIPNTALKSLPPNPDAEDDETSTLRDIPISIDVLANDEDDALPSALGISAVGTPLAGTAVINGDQIDYTPNAGFLGTDTFSYTITDGQASDTATVRVAVNFQGTDLWIPLNEGDGDIIHEAGGSQLGVKSAGVTRIAGPPDAGGALSFAAGSSGIDLPGAPNLPTGSAPRTLMAWIRIAAGESLENQGIFGYGVNSSGERVTFRLSGTNSSHNPGTPYQKLRLEVQNGSIVGNSIVDDGTWHHVAAVINDFNGDSELNVEEVKFYVDGVVDTNAFDAADPIVAPSAVTGRAMSTAAGSTPRLGGANHSAGFTFTGDIDELRVLPGALTTAEILSYKNAPHPANDAWHQRHFGTDPVDWTADTDGDGITRLGELAFGGSPWIHDASALQPMFAFNESTSRFEITYRRREPGSFNVIYTAQASSDLLDWNTLTTTELGTSTLNAVENLEWATFQLDAPAADEPVQFGRVLVELP